MSERPVTPITPGRFVWHELNTQDVAKSAVFYGELFGWKIDASDPEYIHIRAGGQPVAEMIKPPSPAVPTHWLCYVSVADVDATLARAAAVGCTVLAAPLDIEPRRLAVLADPQRAVFEAVPSGGAFSVLQDNQGATFAVVAFGA